MGLNILTRQVAYHLPITLRLHIQHQAGLVSVKPAAKSAGAQKQTEFERHIEVSVGFQTVI